MWLLTRSNWSTVIMLVLVKNSRRPTIRSTTLSLESWIARSQAYLTNSHLQYIHNMYEIVSITSGQSNLTKVKSMGKLGLPCPLQYNVPQDPKFCTSSRISRSIQPCLHSEAVWQTDKLQGSSFATVHNSWSQCSIKTHASHFRFNSPSTIY